MNPSAVRAACFLISVLCLLAGGFGMLLSFGYLASASMADITAGASGFVAGSMLIAAGLLSMTLLTLKPASPTPGAAPDAGETRPA